MDAFEQLASSLRQFSPVAIAAFVLLLLCLALGLRLLLRRPPRRLIAYAGESGSVLVSRKALQELIRQACLKDPQVEAAKAAVSLRNGQASAFVRLRLVSPDQLKAVTGRLQQRVSRLLHHSLGFERVGPVELLVSGFSSKGGDIDEGEPPPDTPSPPPSAPASKPAPKPASEAKPEAETKAAPKPSADAPKKKSPPKKRPPASGKPSDKNPSD